MKCPNWLYRRIDRRGRLPRWVRWIWARAHWCPEMDELLVIDNWEDCYCGVFQALQDARICRHNILLRLQCDLCEKWLHELLDRLQNDEIV